MNELALKISAIAQEVAMTDSLDFGSLAIDEESTYDLIARSVLEMYVSTAEEEREIVTLASLTHLLVENFVLNHKLNKLILKNG